MPTSIAVFGSCVTRDAFNSRFTPGWADRYTLGAVAYRSSLVSLMATPTPIVDEDLRELGATQAQWVRRDFRKDALGELAAAPPDLLLLDFTTDIRFGCLDLGDGRYVTANHSLLDRTGWLGRLEAAGGVRQVRPRRDEARYLALWQDALVRLVGRLAEVAPATAVCVVGARQATRLWLPGGGGPVDLAANRLVPRGDAARFDALWAHLDAMALRTPGWVRIDLRGREYPTSDAHPWSASVTHFAPEFHADLLAAVDAVAAGRAGSNGLTGDGIEAGLLEPGGTLRHVADGIEVLPGLPIGRTWEGEPGAGPMRPRPPRPAAPPRQPQRSPATRLLRVPVRA
ncbi:MAG: DUF6270 domain-containing protein, partial [Chloroflexota bacterium]